MEPERSVVCPICGGSLGEIDVLIGLAIASHIDEAGKIEWAGDTEIDWNSQKPKHNPPRFECTDCGRVFAFTSSQFVEIKED